LTGLIVFASAALPGKLYEGAPHYITQKLSCGRQAFRLIGAQQGNWYDALPTEVQAGALITGADARADGTTPDLETAVEAALKTMGRKRWQNHSPRGSPEFRPGHGAMAWTTPQSPWGRKRWNAEGSRRKDCFKVYYGIAMRAAGDPQPLRDWGQGN